MEDKRFHYQLEGGEEAAKITVEKLTGAGPQFRCPYQGARYQCDARCWCSKWPHISKHQGSYYSIGYNCNNFVFNGNI